MAIAQVYSEQEVDAEIDRQLPGINKDRQLPIPRELAKALFMSENMGPDGKVTFANRISPKGAFGVAQVMPKTVEGLQRTGYLPATFNADPQTATLGDQVLAGLATLREFVDRRKTVDPKKIGALYNAGDGSASMYLKTGDESSLPKETQGYFKKIATAYKTMGLPIMSTQATTTADPAASALPVSIAQQTQERYMELWPELVKAITGGNADTQTARAAAVQAVNTGSQAAAETAQIQANITLAEQATFNEIVKVLGLDVRDPESAINVERNRAASARNERDVLGKQITDLQSRSLFSDPLGWMQGLIELPTLVPQYNRLVGVENEANAEITRMGQIADNMKQHILPKTADLIRAKASADGRAQLAKAQEYAARMDAENASGNARMAIELFTLDEKAYARMVGAEQMDFNRLIRLQHSKDQKEREEAKAKIKEREAARLEMFNSFRKLIAGQDAVPYTQEDYDRMPTKAKEDWERVISSGRLGDYAEATYMIREYGNDAQAGRNGNSDMMVFNRRLIASASALASDIKNKQNAATPLAKLSDKEAMARAYNNLQIEHETQAAKGSDKTNLNDASPYFIDMDSAAAAAAGNKNKSALSSILLREREANPYQSLNKTVTPRTLVNSLSAEVRAGNVSPAVAAKQLSTFVKLQSEANYSTKALNVYGLPRIQDYIVYPGVDTKKKVDLLNEVMLEKYFQSEVVAQRAMAQRPTEGTFNYLIRRGMEGHTDKAGVQFKE